MIARELKLVGADNGNCRVYYRSGSRNLVAYQEDAPGAFTLYVCSRDGEPSHELDHTVYVVDALPEQENATSRDFAAWMRQRGTGLSPR